MKSAKLIQWFFTSLFIPAATSADDQLPSNTTEMIDTWGAVRYCQEIYGEPAVRGRIYSGDLLACEKSDRLLRITSSSAAPAIDQNMLAAGVARKAAAFRYNTVSIQAAVTACREQCRQLAAIYDEKTDTGEISRDQD